MSAGQHTPGPHWYQHGNTIQDGRKLVATLHGSADYINANAARMLATDELVAAAQAIASELDPSGDSYNLSARDYFDAREAVARLRAAIAKATGSAAV